MEFENNVNYIQALKLLQEDKIKELESFTGLGVTEFKRQMCDFLVNVMKWSTRQTSEVLSYAIGTVRNYAKKYKCKIINFLKMAYAGIKAIVKFERTPSLTYLIYLRNSKTGNIKYLKVGKTIDINQRFKTLENQYKCYVEVISLYEFDTEEKALAMEDILRNHYRQLNSDTDFVKNDRFTLSRVTKADLNKFNKKAKAINEFFDE